MKMKKVKRVKTMMKKMKTPHSQLNQKKFRMKMKVLTLMMMTMMSTLAMRMRVKKMIYLRKECHGMKWKNKLKRKIEE